MASFDASLWVPLRVVGARAPAARLPVGVVVRSDIACDTEPRGERRVVGV